MLSNIAKKNLIMIRITIQVYIYYWYNIVSIFTSKSCAADI